jgi:peptidoglycan/xylan/chitin deacetylase (PgdA/CDA1 family)
VPILTYHSLDASGSAISTEPDLFARQLRMLRARGYQGVGLAELLRGREEGGARFERPVAICFDDGLRSVAEHAAPALGAAGFRATVFAVAGPGGTNDWPGQADWAPRQPLLSHAELGALAREGWEVGSHGYQHRALTGLGEAELDQEVSASRERLEDALGVAVTSFAYPYGRADARARARVAACYGQACSTELGWARAESDRFWLPRIDAYYLRRPELFRLFDTRLGRAYLALRALGRRARALRA